MALPGEDPLRRRARETPVRVALEDASGSLTFADLDALADAVAAALGASVADTTGFAEGTTASARRANGDAPVAALLPPGRSAVATLFATGRAGRPLAVLHPGRTELELGAALEELRPAVLLYTAATESAAHAAAPPATALSSLPEPGATPSASRRPPATLSAKTPPIPFDGRVFLLWTSGTSGHPRAVRLRGTALLANARATRTRLGLREDDRWLASLNPAHVGGLALAVRAVALGSRLVLRERFDAEEVTALMEEGRITHASLVPTMLRRLLDARGERPAPPGVRCLLIGGDHAPEALVRRALDRGWPLALTYGLTEACSQVCTAPPDLVRAKPDTAGPPLDGVEVRIGASDEILVRGETLAEDAAAKDGWLHTGDAGRLDEDGHLHVTGRLSDRIISGGVNVDPAPVEEAIRAFPGVRDAAVVGLPDPEWGERVAAAVEWETEDVVRNDALDAHCRALLSGPFRPRVLAALRLPRNPNGKVDRERVRDLLRPRDT